MRTRATLYMPMGVYLAVVAAVLLGAIVADAMGWLG